MKLTELLELQNSVTQKLLENGGLIEGEIEKMLEITEKGLPAKIDNYSLVLDRLEQESKYFKSIADRYRDAASVLNDAHTKLKDRLKMAMLEHGLLELKGREERFALSPAKGSLEVDETKVPEEFKKTTILVEVDKEKIREKIKEGFAVPGCEMKPNFALKRYVNKGN